MTGYSHTFLAAGATAQAVCGSERRHLIVGMFGNTGRSLKERVRSLQLGQLHRESGL